MSDRAVALGPRKCPVLLRAWVVMTLGVAWLGLGPGCARHTPRSPEALRNAYATALAKDDPRAAYALLTPELQAQTTFEAFETRWHAQTAERKAASGQLDALNEADQTPVREGITVHAGGRVLSWTEGPDGYLVVAGLPGSQTMATPAQAVRALIAAIASTDFSRVERLLGEDLASSLREDWQARAQALSEVLKDPSAIELSSDLQRAELRYDTHRVLALEQSAQGWRITALE